MDALIPIETAVIGTEEVNAVNARDLFTALGLKKDFSSWIKAQINSLVFEENVDYIIFTQKGENLSRGRPGTEYILTLDAAKHIAMASRSARGKAVRAYFIEVEKRYRLEGQTRNDNANAVSLRSDPMFEAVLESLQNIGQVVLALGAQMERLDRRLLIYEERERYKRERLRASAQRRVQKIGRFLALADSEYEKRRKAFIVKVQEALLAHAPINQSSLLVKVGYRKDDKTARQWLHEGVGVHWRVSRQKNSIVYRLPDGFAKESIKESS